jgi:hypothetical protein
MHRGEQPGHLSQRPELEDGVVERGLPLQQDAAELEHDAEAERQRHGHGPHLAGHRGVGVDDDLGLAAAQAGHFLRGVEILPGPHPRELLRRGDQREPDELTLEPAHQGHAAALEQLSLGAGEATSGGKGTGKSGKRGRRGSHLQVYPWA